ncbi:MAG: ABC transporter ATP-binding protein [Arenicella sp.]
MFLEIDSLQKSFADIDVLKGIDISVEKGDFLVLVGPSGCGKSTLLNTIAGLESVTQGEIRINGRSVNDLQASERDIAMVFQSYALYPSMNVGANIAFGMQMRGVAKPERDKAVKEVAEMLKISHLLDRKPGQLSGGQRQRVAMGRALVRDPQIFLFDEPLSNLDAKLRVDVRNEIKRLHQRMQTTMVYVTHDQIEALTLATKIAVLKDGYLQQVGTPAEIYDDPANIFVADFMGSPAMNLIDASVVIRADTLQIQIKNSGGECLYLPVDQTKGRLLKAWQNKNIVFGIRPEQVTDTGSADQQAHSICEASCVVDLVEPAGADTYVVTQLAGQEAIFRMRANAQVQAGESVQFAFNMDKAVFFDPANGQRIA